MTSNLTDFFSFLMHFMCHMSKVVNKGLETSFIFSSLPGAVIRDFLCVMTVISKVNNFISFPTTEKCGVISYNYTRCF